jgi:hypothetical protein
MLSNQREEVTPREWATMNHEKEMFDKQVAHQQRIKELDIEARKIEARWSSLLRIPVLFLKLPVALAVSLVLGVYAIRGLEPPESLTSFIRS